MYQSKNKKQKGFKTIWLKNNQDTSLKTAGYHSMRGWQVSAFETLKNVSHMILNAPMGSGKSWMMCFLSAFKMKKNHNIRCIITVPQTIIASGFLKEKLQMPDGENINWKVGHNLCNKKLSQGTVKYIVNWLSKLNYESQDDRILICTHATITKVYQKLEILGRLDLLNNLILWVDEAHHIKNINVNNEGIIIGNALGNLVRNLVYKQNDNVEVGLTTASFFRGDRSTLITPSMEESFVRFNLPYDDYLKSMIHLKSFSFDFLLCDYDYTQAIEIIAKERTGKDIIYIPHPMSKHSTRNKFQEITDMICKYQNVHGGIVEPQNNQGLIVLSGINKNFKILDLVDDKDRDKKKDYINNKALKDDSNSLDIIFALGMFKEGANWIWADRSIIVGIRNSLVDLVQMVGRLFRDAPGKEHVEVIQLLPFTMNQQDKKFEKNLNNYLKAIFSSLILEDILEPIKIKNPVKKESVQGNYAEPDLSQFSQLVSDKTTRQLLLSEVTKHIFNVASESKKNGIDSYYDKYQEGIPDIIEQFGIADKDRATAIGEHIWKMWLRRTYKSFNGISIKDVDISLLKNMDPRECLLGYTSGPCGIDTFEKLRAAIQKSYNWRSYESAREWVLKLNLMSERDWRKYISGEMTNLPPLPDDIPRAPWIAYKDKGWINWGHFLGTNMIAPRLKKYFSYEEACKFVHNLKLTKKDHWILYLKGAFPELPTLPDNIPACPDKTYKRKDYESKWTTWGHFLGTERVSNKNKANNYRPYQEAHIFAKALNLKTAKEWRRYINGEFGHLPLLPHNIPRKPDASYNKWIDWPSFLGSEISKFSNKRHFLLFVQAREFARTLGLRTQKDWINYCAGKFPLLPKKPDNIPSNLYKKYKKSGWAGYKDWFGY